MLVVKVELWPLGDGSRPQELGRLVIGNRGTLPTGGSCYDVRARAEAWPGVHGVKEGAGSVLDYPRKQQVWNLVRAALDEMKWDM